MTGSVVDLFAGPGGLDVALRALGLTDVLGVEIDTAAAATRRAAGHRTLVADVAALDPRTVAASIDGLVGSPPCPLYSVAGKQYGRRAIPLLDTATRDLVAGRDVRADVRQAIADLLEPIVAADHPDDPQGALALDGLPTLVRVEAERLAYEAALVLEPARWVEQLRPRWVALEQVPAVLPLWQTLGAALADLGYSWAAGILNAADYGVPQTRRRAIFVARLDGPAELPRPTHVKGGGHGLRPWVSMADALGWGLTDRPAPTMPGAGTSGGGPRPLDDGSGARETIEREQAEGRWAWRLEERKAHGARRSLDEPAMTITGAADNGNFRFVLNTGLDWKPDGTRDDAQKVEGDQPAPTLTSVSGRQWWLERPATTLAGDPRVFPPGGHLANDGRDNARMVGRSENTLRLEVPQALALQTFPPDYPVQGTRTQQFLQIGNAVPPRLAEHVIAALLGLDAREVAA